jgi:hypothetical protein
LLIRLSILGAPMPIKKRTKAQFDKAFTPVAIQIGRLARLWNALHENMGIIFAALVSQENPNIPLAVWHSTNAVRSLGSIVITVSNIGFTGSRVPDDPVICRGTT